MVRGSSRSAGQEEGGPQENPEVEPERVVAEVVEDTASKRSPANKETGTIARQLWAPEANLFSSRLERKTASAPPGRKYFENGAWQAWLLGL